MDAFLKIILCPIIPIFILFYSTNGDTARLIAGERDELQENIRCVIRRATFRAWRGGVQGIQVRLNSKGAYRITNFG